MSSPARSLPMTVVDRRLMSRALRLARRGLYTTDPNPRVGCVIAHGERVVGEGWHARAGTPHAEIHALEAAGAAARGATAYVTLEPCCHHGRTPPCSQALIRAGVARVVVAMEDPNPRVAGQGLAQLREAGIEVQSGLLETEARALNPGFIRRMANGRPFVRLKQAMSLDGRTAMASGESRWITGPEARTDVHRLRARAGAVLTGVDTVLADDPSLNVRLDPATLGIEDEVRQPLRVILDSRLRTPPDARLFDLPGPTLVLTGSSDPDAIQSLEARGAEVATLPMEAGRVALGAVMERLAEREVNELHVEAGPTLAGALLAGGLVDELVVYMAPVLLGSEARGLAALPGLERMADRLHLEWGPMRAIGRDWRITALPGG